MSAPYKQVALKALTDMAREILLDGKREISEADQQRLFNAAVAALELGATGEEVSTALQGGLP